MSVSFFFTSCVAWSVFAATHLSRNVFEPTGHHPQAGVMLYMLQVLIEESVVHKVNTYQDLVMKAKGPVLMACKSVLYLY